MKEWRYLVFLVKYHLNRWIREKKQGGVFYIGGSDVFLMYLRRNSKTKTEVSIDEPLNVDWEGNELLLSDILGTENDIITKDIENKVDRELLQDAMQKLSGRERRIVEMRFGILPETEEKTQKEVADILGISQSYISRLEKKIMRRLKKEISKMM